MHIVHFSLKHPVFIIMHLKVTNFGIEFANWIKSIEYQQMNLYKQTIYSILYTIEISE